MKIARIEDFHCDAGWRNFSFLKITADNGTVGWAEYIERFGGGVTAMIQGLGGRLVGLDPRPVELLTEILHGYTRDARGGVSQWAIAAIENALVDLKARHLGISVAELLCGPVRDRIPLYWSHCGFARVQFPEKVGEWTGGTPIATLDDLSTHVANIRRAGFKGLKTNPVRFDMQPPYIHLPGFNSPKGQVARLAEHDLVTGIARQMQVVRQAAGDAMALHLDLNFNFKTDGFVRMARAVEDVDLAWLEIDSYCPDALADVRRAVQTPIASGEALLGREQFLPFLQKRSLDVAIIDITWNGILGSMKIAALADMFEINVAPHNFNGHLGTFMSAQFCAAVKNLQTMEIDIEDVSWKDDLVTKLPSVHAGEMLVTGGVGWGTEVDENALLAHPPRAR